MWAWALAFWCVACGGSDDASAPPGDAGVDQAGGAGGGGSGGSAGSAGSSGSSGAGTGGTGGSSGSGGSAGVGGSGAVVGDGYIFAKQTSTGHDVSATFDLWQPSPLCTFRNAGPCRLDMCALATTHADAGEVAVSVGALRRAPAQSPPGVYSGTWDGPFWQPGESVRFTSAGAAGPAIDETVTGPAEFTLIEPVPESTVPASRSQAFRARWSGGQYGTAVIAFVGNTASRQSLHVKCSFDAALGEGLVPAGALTELDPAQPVTLVALVESYRSFTTDGWILRVAARTDSVSANVVLQ